MFVMLHESISKKVPFPTLCPCMVHPSYFSSVFLVHSTSHHIYILVSLVFNSRKLTHLQMLRPEISFSVSSVMAFYRSTTFQNFMNEDKNNTSTIRPHYQSPLQTYPRISKSEPQFSPARFSTASHVTSGQESPWTRTPLHLSPLPTLLYQCIGSLHHNEGNILSIAVLHGNVFTGSESNRIRVWKQPDFVERGYLKTSSGEVRAMLAYGDMLFTTHRDRKIRAWNVTSNNSNYFHPKKLMMLSKSNAFPSLRFLPWRKKLQNKDYTTCLAYYHAEGLLYTGSSEKTVSVWRVSDQRCIDSFVAHNDAVKAIVVNQEDGCVFTCSSDGTIKIWRRVPGEMSHALTMTLKFQLSPVNALALSYSAESCHLYSASSDGFINYWEKETVSGRFTHGGFLQGHQNSVLCLAAKGRLIFSGSEDTTIRVWRREGGSFHQCLTVLNGHTEAVQCLAACLEMEKIAMGFLVLSASIDGTLKIWRVKILPEDSDVIQDHRVQCDSSSTIPFEYRMSPVLSPSWVEKKLQGS